MSDAGLGRHGTAALIRDKFPSTLKLVDSLVRSEDVKRYTSDYTAIVDSGPGPKAAGGSALAVSSMPLRTASASGHRKPVDLSLRGRGGGFEPANALSDFSLPADLAKGIQLPADIPLSVASGDPSGIAPSRVGASTALRHTLVMAVGGTGQIQLTTTQRTRSCSRCTAISRRLPC